MYLSASLLAEIYMYKISHFYLLITTFFFASFPQNCRINLSNHLAILSRKYFNLHNNNKTSFDTNGKPISN